MVVLASPCPGTVVAGEDSEDDGSIDSDVAGVAGIGIGIGTGVIVEEDDICIGDAIESEDVGMMGDAMAIDMLLAPGCCCCCCCCCDIATGMDI